ncbi:hypothetical protein Tcan_01108, partial [Toxocara canis]
MSSFAKVALVLTYLQNHASAKLRYLVLPFIQMGTKEEQRVHPFQFFCYTACASRFKLAFHHMVFFVKGNNFMELSEYNSWVVALKSTSHGKSSLPLEINVFPAVETN